MRSRIRPRCAISLGKSIVVAYSNSRSPREYEFATDSRLKPERSDLSTNWAICITELAVPPKPA